MPLSRATAGISAGSAYGARKRTTRCRPRNSALRMAAGTQKLPVIVSNMVISMVAL